MPNEREASLRDFLSPTGAGVRWYLFTRSGWWMASTLMLFALGVCCAMRMLRARSIDAVGSVVALLAISHALYIFVAPGSPTQHVIYDPLLAAGVLIGLGTLRGGPMRTSLLAIFAGLAFLGNAAQACETWRDWRDQEECG